MSSKIFCTSTVLHPQSTGLRARVTKPQENLHQARRGFENLVNTLRPSQGFRV